MKDGNHTGRLMHQCGHLFLLYMNMHLRQYAITPTQSHAIMFLSQREGGTPVTQRDLERELQLKAPSVNGLVSRMEERGMIQRKTSSEDARCRILTLTDSGRDLVNHFTEAVERSEALVDKTLSEEERASLRSMLLRLIETLEREVAK